MVVRIASVRAARRAVPQAGDVLQVLRWFVADQFHLTLKE